MLTFTPILEHLWNTRPSCRFGADHVFLHTREKVVFSCTNSPRGIISCDVSGTQQTREQKELNARKREGQDATKITSAPAESCIQFLWAMMPILMTGADVDGEKHSQSKHHRGFHRGDQ